MRKAVLRTVLAEHLAVLHRRETELERILAGDSRLFAAGAGPSQFQEDLDRVRLVIRGFDELLPKAWELEPGSPPRREVNRVVEAKALVRVSRLRTSIPARKSGRSLSMQAPRA